MPQLTLSESAASDNAIAADTGREFLEFCPTADCRWSFGATYEAADSQRLPAGDARIFQGDLAKLAFSFSASKACKVDVTTRE